MVFAHISMQFGLPGLPTPIGKEVWTFPMFLSPSYRASGEPVPERYTWAEKRALQCSDRILTPSHFEKRQLVEFYGVPEPKVKVVPRGVSLNHFVPRVRMAGESPVLCSVGSIKSQKNTLGLVRTLAEVRRRLPGARLRLIGPEQNSAYAARVKQEIVRLGLCGAIEHVGYVPRAEIASVTADAHVHLSTSACETFGRSIFETLAMGMPNVALRANNAAADYLSSHPCASFVSSDAEAADAVVETLSHLTELSPLAVRLGQLYDDHLLGRLLLAELAQREVMAISDFDQRRGEKCIYLI